MLYKVIEFIFCGCDLIEYILLYLIFVVVGNLVEIFFLNIVLLFGFCINFVVDLLLNCLFVIRVYCFKVFLFLKFYKIFEYLKFVIGFGNRVCMMVLMVGFWKKFLIFLIIFFLDVMVILNIFCFYI